MNPLWCETNSLVCDGDLVRLASGLGFRRYVRGATGVHDLDLYAIMSGIPALVVGSAGLEHASATAAVNPHKRDSPLVGDIILGAFGRTGSDGR